MNIEKVEDTLYCCYLKDRGFYAKAQNGRSIYVTFTQDIKEARLYKTKRAAALALNYRKPDHQDLSYYEVKMVAHYPNLN